MAHHYTLAILLEGAAVLTLLQLIKRYNQSIPEGRKTVRLEANCVWKSQNIQTYVSSSG